MRIYTGQNGVLLHVTPRGDENKTVFVSNINKESGHAV